jgi:hypothetical protein
MRNCRILKVLQNPDNLALMTLADWDFLIREARQSNLLAKLHALVIRHDLMEKVPAQPRRHLEWASVIAERHVLSVQQEINLIEKALRPLDIPVILLKGAAYFALKLPGYQVRFFSDIDILVSREHLNATEAALMLHGWATTHHDAYDQHYYRAWMHELPPMQHIKRQTVIDVHHAILPGTASIHPDSQKLIAAVEKLHGNIHVLSPIDMILHSATHLFHGGEMENGLRDLTDIDMLFRQFGDNPMFWDKLTTRAQTLELSRPLFYALRYTGMLLNTPIPKGTDNRPGAPNLMLLSLMDALFIRSLLPVPCSDGLANMARFLLYVRANWQRMPPFLLAKHLFHKAFISSKE